MNEESFKPSGSTATAYPGAPHIGESPLKEKANETADEMRAEAQKLKSAAREQSAAAVEQIKAGVQSATHQAQIAGRDFIRSQQSTLAERCSAYADAARAASRRLEEGEGNMLAAPAQKAADQLERLSGYLRDKDPGDLMGDVEAFARRRPEIVFGGLFVAGLAAARFLKASRRSLDERTRSRAVVPTSGADALEPIRPFPTSDIGSPGISPSPEATGVGTTSPPPWTSSSPAPEIPTRPAPSPSTNPPLL